MRLQTSNAYRSSGKHLDFNIIIIIIIIMFIKQS